MCSFFTQKMEKDQGDLADIVRASGSNSGANNQIVDWQVRSEDINFPSEPIEDFGDPFSCLQDPLPHDLAVNDSGFFGSPQTCKMNIEEHSSVSGNLLAQTMLNEEIRRPSNIFSTMLQISPNPKIHISPREITTVMTSPRRPQIGNDKIKSDSSTSCPVENIAVQISSPRNPGIKRRKSQAKKVVCIPAPSAANSRPGGEVVPSDLWAWRKYGQKPIKGSPYPRGYYRCSSSKGCSARKQVERSRTDPNMLVITYTSEHNHPWPTQRNALAGSTRSQPPKSNISSKTSPYTNTMEDHKEKMNQTSSSLVSSSSIISSSIKEEMGATQIATDEELDQNNYLPATTKSNQSEDFFADLGELDADNLFTQGFAGERGEDERDIKALDPFSLFDWAGNNNPFGEAKGGF